ncbi:peptidase inhibitor 16-like [Catharus ustulatus]|uniref:peptidase inhibitor 16-like n=1 Tax=Catharus ustulatus TaxID=91951 RepID=UPI0014094268|nr:peptidase inhibitor 16-like [Catharus ustulatus]
MLSSGLPPLLLVLSMLELSWSLSDEEKKIIVDEHNKYRSQVSPPARVMKKMTWDTDLEITAQNHARDCNWIRNGGGKNLFATTSTLDVKLAIEAWNREREFYNFSTSECDPGRTCDDYIQVIWAETTHIGCESSPCKKVEGDKTENVQLLVCIYFPRSNIKDKMPYWEGPPCTKCPPGTVCVNNLCEKLDQISAAPPKGTCLGLSLFLLPSAILLDLLL